MSYFDHNATTPLHPAAREAWLRASDTSWQNPSSLYREAGAVRRKLEAARERLADLLGADPERLIFTSGATESNNALFHMLAGKIDPDSLVLTSAVEHPSVREPLQKEFGKRMRVINTNTDTGLFVDTGHLVELLVEEQVGFVSIMALNNECGTLLPWHSYSRLCRENGVPFHTDASQWIGKLSAHELGQCDYVTGSAHKFGGPKGVGFLLMQSEDEALSFLRGGPQEEGRRAGTENYPAIEAMVTALEGVTTTLKEASRQQRRLRDAFCQSVISLLPGTKIIGNNTAVWNTAMLVLPAHDNRKWLARLSDHGFAISTGSACSAGHDGSSVVLSALGASPDEMRRVVRISGGWDTTAADWQALAAAFKTVAGELEQSPLTRSAKISP